MKKDRRFWAIYWKMLFGMLLPPIIAIGLLLLTENYLLLDERSFLGLTPVWEHRLATIGCIVVLTVYYLIFSRKAAQSYLELLKCGTALVEGDCSYRIRTRAFGSLLGDLYRLYNGACSILQTTTEQVLPVVTEVEDGVNDARSKLLPMRTSLAKQIIGCNVCLEASRSAQDSMHVTAEHVQIAHQLLEKIRTSLMVAGKEMQLLKLSARRLQEASAAASDIIRNTEEISFQTHILSILANVESVSTQSQSSNDAFDVIAKEIKLLADESSQSALETKTQIAAILSAVENGVTAVENTAVAMEEAAAHVERITGHMVMLHRRMKEEETVAGNAHTTLLDIFEEIKTNQERLDLLTASSVSLLKDVRALRHTSVLFQKMDNIQKTAKTNS